VTPADAPYWSGQQAGRDGFPQLLRAEWTKFRTVRGCVAGMAAAALMVVLIAVLAGISSNQHDRPAVPIGPGGEPVTDSFYFVHRPLAGNGSITVSVSALRANSPRDLQPATVPWAKAGLIIKASVRQGSPYAAIMVTRSHGVRMQYDYVHDTAGIPGSVAASPRWLRLDRSGDAVTGYDSVDGTHWTEVGTVHVAGLGPAVQGGLFVASPDSVQGIGTDTSVSTADFGNLGIQGSWLGGNWTGDQVGAESPGSSGQPAFDPGTFTESGGTFTVTGTGDIAPAVRGSLGGAGVIGDILFGAFPALITVIVLGTRFITAEYRDDMIRVTLAASPRRGRVLAAKAIVLGAVTFAAGLAGAVVAVPVGERLARANGVYLFPVTFATQLRVEAGTAALLAAASILALAVGTIFRRSAGAVTAVIAAIVVPYLLVAQIPFLPAGVTDWLTRVTPAAAFAVQQTLVPYPQVTSNYTPYNGYYPLTPWAGLAVLAGYAVLALAVAAVLLRRRDA
jgi:ABC-type transport system involved in multi-copper enzyme maturation permease subunit